MRIVVWFLLIMSLFYITACSTSGAGKKSVKSTAPMVKKASYDRDYAAMLGGSCTTCHIKGAKNTKIPAIHGAEKEILFEILKAFKYSEYESGTMEKIAKTFSDKELELISHYFAEQK